jgi:hypothetical protein
VLQPATEPLPHVDDGQDDASAGTDRDARPPVPANLDAGPGLDPDARFDWEDTEPSLGSCPEGRYAGAFQCRTGPSSQLTGPIEFTLSGSNEEETLRIEEGHFSDSNGLFQGMLEGTLDCANQVLHASSVDATICATPACSMPSTLEATFDAPFTAESAFFFGTWTFEADAGTCTGSWTAQAAP